MEIKRRIGFQSALLVSWGVIGLSFTAALLMWRFDLPDLGVLLMAVAVTGLVSRLWGLYALRRVEAEAIPARETLSVGRSVTVRYTVKNDKALPLIWLELMQDIPVRDCLTPDGSLIRRRFTPEEAERTGRTEAYLRRLAFVPGYGSLEWETEWTGVRRGIYRPQALTLRSGDGFGLTQSTGEAAGLRGRVLVVWPRLVPVRTEPFLRTVWTGAAGSLGWTEDPTVLRGERAYQPGDPWKRIDWRTAARTDELMVRQFETIRPLGMLFLLDAAALEDPEEAISLLASLIRELGSRGVACGLALPATGALGPLLLRAEDPGTTPEACLFALAEFEVETASGRFAERAVLTAAAETGRVYVLTQSEGAMGCAALTERMTASVSLLCARREGGAGAQTLTFDELRRREAAV